MIFPPIGFFSLPAYGPAAASGVDITWFVTTTAIPNWKKVSKSKKRKTSLKPHRLIVVVCEGIFPDGSDETRVLRGH